MNTHWSLGVLIGGPITILLLAACAVVIWLAGRAVDDEDRWLARVLAGIVATVVFVIAAFAYFPYKAEYHQWRPASGTVTAVSSRILTQDTDISQRFVVTFDNGLTRSCDDTRCSLIKKGDFLALTCKRHWQFAGTSGYDCNFVSRRAG